MLPAPLALLTWNLPPDLLFPFLKRCPFRELNSTRVEATFAERSTCNEARRPLFLNTACAAGLALIRADSARRWSGWKANYGPDLPWVGTRLSANRKRVEAKHPVLLHIMDVIAAVICVFHGWKSQWILREVFVLPVFFILFFFFSVGQVGGQTLLGSDLSPSEEPWLVLLQCSNVSGGVGGKREEEEPQSHSIYAFCSLVMD